MCATATHLWNACVLHFVLFSAEEMPSDNPVTKEDQTGPFIRPPPPTPAPQQRNACFPLRAPAEPCRGKLTTFHGSPLLAQLGQHLGLASGPLFSGTQPFLPDLLPSEFRASGKLLLSAQLLRSPFTLVSTLLGRVPAHDGKHPVSTPTILCGAFPPLDVPLCCGCLSHPFCMFCLRCFFCTILHAILFHFLFSFTC